MKQRFSIKPIRTEREYKRALEFLDENFDAKGGTDEGDLVEVVAILVEKYEEAHFPIESPDPVEAIKFRMEQSGMTTSDLAKLLGGRNRVSEILNYKRRLTLEKVKLLSQKWKIPAESLLGT
jgi:HTH-type transcriptional regulator/antitoxin HigA